MIQLTAPWALKLILDLDRHHPGFCGFVLRASGERRQVIAAYLAAKPPSECEPVEVGRFLMEADHRTILASAYGEYVSGSRGALRRVGDIIAEERLYTLLHQLLADPAQSDVRKCIAHLEVVTLTKLLITAFLAQSETCRSVTLANVVESIDDMQMASDVETAMTLLVGRGIDGDELAASIRQVRSRDELFKVIERSCLQASAPRHPVPSTDWYRPVEDPRTLQKIGLRYRNCARRYATDLLDEHAGHAFAEVRQGSQGAVVHLLRKDGHWTVANIVGPRNTPPTRALKERIERHLEREGGVRIERRRRRPPSDWDAVRRLSNVSVFDFDFD